MTTILAPWPKGIDNVAETIGLEAGAVADAVNGVFVNGGAFVRRDGEVLLLDEVWHSGVEAFGKSFACRGAEFGVVDYDGTTLTFSKVADLLSTLPVSYTMLNDALIVSSDIEINKLTLTPTGFSFAPLGVPEVPWFSLTPTVGSLDAGRYGVAISVVNADGEEGALSDVQFVDVPANGGIHIDLPIINTQRDPQAAGFKLYNTAPNGEQLYFVGQTGFPQSVEIQSKLLGNPAQTQYLNRMSPGRYVLAWEGRLLTAAGRVLNISEPMNYGLIDRRHNFVQFPHPVYWINGVKGGVFIGTSIGVFFLDGSKPGDWHIALVDAETPLQGASVIVPTSLFGDALELPQGVNQVVVWLTASGYHLGLPQGAVLRPQSGRIEINVAGLKGSLSAISGVLTAIIQ